MIDPNDVAEALWQTEQGKKMFDTWAEVPAPSKEIWRGSYDAFVGALNQAGYGVCALASTPSETVGRGEDERKLVEDFRALMKRCEWDASGSYDSKCNYINYFWNMTNSAVLLKMLERL